MSSKQIIALRRIRLEQGLSQHELGLKVGLTQVAISALERKARNGSVLAWDRISEALGVDQKTLRQIEN